jgi:hypothetical protein
MIGPTEYQSEVEARLNPYMSHSLLWRLSRCLLVETKDLMRIKRSETCGVREPNYQYSQCNRDRIHEVWILNEVAVADEENMRVLRYIFSCHDGAVVSQA